MKKNKYILIFSFIILFIFWSAGFAHAALEITYPNIPGLPSLNPPNKPNIGEFVAYWFGLLVYIAGILSLISFTVGAVQLITPNIEAHNDAKDRMKGAVLGLTLTIASFIIIRTINPTLITPSLTPLPGVAGVFYVNGAGEKRPVGLEVSDVKNRGEDLINGGFNSLIYDCSDVNVAPALLVWEFPNANFTGNNGGYDGINVERITCGNQEPIASLGSFRMAFETPGVYYCFGGCGGDMCSGYMSGAVTNNQDDIGAPFTGNIQGVRIVNGSGLYYGVIFHGEIGLENGGECATPIINDSQNSQCQPVNILTAAADIFVLNKDSNSGNGVIFYSRSNGWNTDTLGNRGAGFFPVSNEEINSPFLKEDLTQDGTMCFDYTNVDAPETYKYKCSDSKCEGDDYSCEDDSDCYMDETCDTVSHSCVGENGAVLCSDSACETFQDCPGSVEIKGSYLGSYLVGIYSKDAEDNLYCYTSAETIPNLGTKGIIAPGAVDVKEVYIIPIK